MCYSAFAVEAAATSDECLGHVWEKEVVVYVSCEEDTFNYEMNPNYRYTFVWEVPTKTRAVCYNCGRSTMSLVKEKEQTDSDGKMCPVAPAALYSDIFNQWYTYTLEKCTSCGYKGEEYDPVRSYTSRCYNDDNPSENGEWEVRAEYTMANGYNPLQSLNWWLYYSYD